MIKQAYFVRMPRTINDLMRPHPVEYERRYEVAKEIILEQIEYENFVTDMLVDRCFIEDNEKLCSESGIFKCLFVHIRGRNDGVLVIPEEKCFVKYAAYVINQ